LQIDFSLDKPGKSSYGLKAFLSSSPTLAERLLASMDNPTEQVTYSNNDILISLDEQIMNMFDSTCIGGTRSKL
jgi:hypothetical protein